MKLKSILQSWLTKSEPSREGASIALDDKEQSFIRNKKTKTYTRQDGFHPNLSYDLPNTPVENLFIGAMDLETARRVFG